MVARALGLSTQQLSESFQPARAEHLGGVVQLRQRLFGSTIWWDDARYLTWRYRFGSTTSGHGECWVLVLAGAVVGMVGAEEVTLQRAEFHLPTWSTMDIAIDPGFEGSGVGSWMNLRLCELSVCAITIGSNEKSRNMITRTFARLPNRRSYVMPIDFGRLFRKRMGDNAVASMAARGAGYAAALIRFGALWGTRGQFQLRPIQRFDASVGSLISRSVDTSEWTMVRTVDFLNWRLFGNPRAQCSVIGAYSQGRLLGFLATQLCGKRTEHKSLVLFDWLVDRSVFRPVFSALCADAVRAAVRARAELVSVTAYNDTSEGALRRLGFLARNNEYETIAVHSADAGTLRALLEPGPWFVTEANTDRDAP